MIKKKKRRKDRTFILYIFLIFCFLGAIKTITRTYVVKEEPTEIESTLNETNEASILAIGDVMVHGPQLEAQYNSSTNSYDFNNNFKHVKKYIENADYSIANLETTLAGNEHFEYSSFPLFNSPDELADALKIAGLDLISTINNHSFDKSDLGVERTLSVLNEKGFDTVGTKQEDSHDDYIIKNINNISFGITSYSYGDIKNDNKFLNGIKISEEKENKMNIFDSSNVDNAFQTISSTTDKFKDTDIQIVILHWGDEYDRNGNNFQRELAQKLCDDGIDIIIGSHPHVVQPVETITSTDSKNETTVIYSLGNHISNQRRSSIGLYSEDGLMVSINISKANDNPAKVQKVTCIPTWVNKYQDNSKYIYEVIPLDENTPIESLESIKESDLEQSYNNTSSLIDTSDIISISNSPFN